MSSPLPEESRLRQRLRRVADATKNAARRSYDAAKNAAKRGFTVTRTVAVKAAHLSVEGAQRLNRFLRELDRKGFHVLGLIMPLIYYLGLSNTRFGGPVLTQTSASIIMGVVAGVFVTVEVLRKLSAKFNAGFIVVFGRILRDSEADRPTGMVYYLCGGFLSIALYPPAVAITCQLYLIFGDFAAALVGVSMGSIQVVKGKSLEGCLACFCTCAVVTCAVLGWQLLPTHFWALVVLSSGGALAATLAETFPLLDDNLSMPLFGGMALVLLQTVFCFPPFVLQGASG